MYKIQKWSDRTVEFPRRFVLRDDGEGHTTLTPAPGEVLAPGTEFTAENMNHMETGIDSAALMASYFFQMFGQTEEKAIVSVCRKKAALDGSVELQAGDVGAVSKAAYEEKVRQIETELGKKHDVTKDGKPVTSINTRKPDAAGNMTVREGAKILTAKFLLDGWASSSGKFEQTVTCTGMQAASNYSPPWIYKTGVENTDEALMEALGCLYAGVMTALDGQIKAVVPDKPTADIEVHLREAKA